MVASIVIVANFPEMRYKNIYNIISYMRTDSIGTEKILSELTLVGESTIGAPTLYNFNSDTLVVAVEKDVPGLFLFRHHYHGYFDNILKEYALARGKILKYENHNSRSTIEASLRTSDIAFGLIISDTIAIDNMECYLSSSLKDSCKYIVLGNKLNTKLNRLPLNDVLESASVIFRRGSSRIPVIGEHTIKYLRDSTQTRFLSTEEYIDLIIGLAYDFIICREDEAFFYIYNYGDIVRTHSINHSVHSEAVFHWRNAPIYNDFEEWLAEFRTTDTYKTIENKYDRNAYKYDYMADGYLNPIRGVSHYDDIFKVEAKKCKYKWQFLAAIASVESRFNPVLVSNKGAVGMMQIMPINTRHLGLDSEDLKNPNTNVSCAVLVLNDNLRMLRLTGDPNSINNLSIQLATYNAGYGHVSDAMRLARRYKENDKDWEVIKKYLRKKREYEYYSQRSYVKSGSLDSRGVEHYVELVIERYLNYLEMTKSQSK